MTQTEAQKRAKKNYIIRHNITQWKADIPDELNKKVEAKRKKKGLTKKQVLEHFLKEE